MNTVSGLACLVVNIIMYAGPIAGIQEALAAQSTEFLPLSLGVSTLTCSLPWTLFGFAIWNPNVFIPNACGIVFGTVQIIIFAYLARRSTIVSPTFHDSMVQAHLQKVASAGNIFFLMKKRRGLTRARTWDTPLHPAQDKVPTLRSISTAPGQLSREHRGSMHSGNSNSNASLVPVSEE
jgi:hypothetical protein